MGSIQDLPVEEHCVGNNSLNLSSNGGTNGSLLRSFEVANLASHHGLTPTGMRDEVLLLSWLLVLYRTRERDQVRCQWAYRLEPHGYESVQPPQDLSLDDFLEGSPSNIQQTTSAVSQYLATIRRSVDVAEPVSLLLSTGPLDYISQDLEDGILHLQVTFRDDRLEIVPVWQSENMLPYTVTRHIETLVDIMKMCLANGEATIEDCIQPTDHDMQTIWKLNHSLPPSYQFCMHDLISERARKCPDKVAICSWDGDLTYAQIDQFSTYLAHNLRDMSVKLHDVVPICFEKSRWTIVAVLAAMKAGSTFVLMDPTLPLARLQNTAVQVGAKLMLASRQQKDLSKLILPEGRLLVVDSLAFEGLIDVERRPELPPVPPSALMYIIFTSGSTGVPKGVMLSHETYTSSAIPRAEAVGYKEHSRVLDFASYAFDVSIDSMLCTISQGGCLCIPSDEERMNDINGVMRKMKVNYAGLTPSVGRILDADVIESLDMLGLGGEAVTARDVTRWGKVTRIVIGYGPCECTIGCTVNSSAATGRDYISIGNGTGAVMWIVDPSDHEKLMPVGATGELLVEGPIVGQGYLNDPAKTATAFIEDPAWLVSGYKSHNGRRGRLYKTGDLGKYDPDGSGGIVFVGRKDTQVKLRGQRVELGEIEYQLNMILPPATNAIAEVVKSNGADGQATLVAFVAPHAPRNNEGDLQIVQPSDKLRNALSRADDELSKVLPRYMVPTTYIPLNYIPVLISGKTDRKRLRQFGASSDLRILSHSSSSESNRELDHVEQHLRNAWSQTLKVEAESVGLQDNFFALGGDSLAAMKLVSVGRANGLRLTVANVFLHPTLSSMAKVTNLIDSEEIFNTATFSMISQPVETARLEAARACGSKELDVEDIYPCTPTQEGLFTFSLKSDTPYVAQRVACIPENIDVAAWKEAWGHVVQECPILRTRLIQSSEPGLWQVILKEKLTWRHSDDLSQYLEIDKTEKMDLGQSLARYAIVTDAQAGKHYMVWTIHHVVYDGWSEPLILKKVSKALQGQFINSRVQMRDVVRYLQDINPADLQSFWRNELEGAIGPHFPWAPSRDFLPTANTMLEHRIQVDMSTISRFTLATIIRAAWALVVSCYTSSSDVIFIETLTGRDIALPEVEEIEGPLIATIPIRVRIDRTATVEAYLQAVQEGMLARTPFQHFGVQNIRKVSDDAQYACEARTGLVIQPEPEYSTAALGFEQGDVVREALHFNPYPLMLGCGIQKDGFRICASFDSTLITAVQMERIFAQLETACTRLTESVSTRLDHICIMPEKELDQIWHMNRLAPMSLERSSTRLRARTDVEPDSIYPPAVVSWVCNIWNPSFLSPIECAGELWLEGDFFPGETVNSPSWLVAGSTNHAGRNGKVHATGDIVRLREDGSLLYVGRKEDVTSLNHFAVNISEIEAHLRKRLPQGYHATASLIQKGSENEVIALIESEPTQDTSVQLMFANLKVTCDGPASQELTMTLCARISAGLAVILKELKKSLSDTLPPYMVPSAYVVVDKIPSESDGAGRSVLSQLVSKIPQDMLASSQENLKSEWARISGQRNLTDGERILQSSWATILRLDSDKIDLDDNFFRLGGDSVLAMKLVSEVRLQGYMLTVADIFQNMRLRDAAKVLKVAQATKDQIQPYKPFSTLKNLNIGSFLLREVRPRLSNPQWSIKDVLPCTSSQVLDIKATIQVPRASVQYTMLYLDDWVEQERLMRATDELVKSHDILRTIFIEHETSFYQVVVDDFETPWSIQSTTENLERYVCKLCEQDIESDFSLGSSFLKIFYVPGNEGKACFILRLSHAQFDGVSLPLLLRDFETLYTGYKQPLTKQFTSYVARTYDETLRSAANNYWRDLLEGSSLSLLDYGPVETTDKALFLTLPVDIAQRLEETTTASLLVAAWALVLARRLQISDVTFGNVTSGRLLDLDESDQVIGPCYQFTPVRVTFEESWTVYDLLKSVQLQMAKSLVHEFLGFDEISRNCTSWPASDKFFDSIVHHQDWEDFDTMPFAGGTCTVDIKNPHGDSAYPLKVVSLLRDGQTHVGVVGSERNSQVVRGILDDLVKVVENLADPDVEKKKILVSSLR
ncbi:hypothetical protein PV08_02213 [Exophiala spinifera]|uniref:Carrier domain-containing protein n=1 Tax=Exophiala spinifera TaxID=91928 RepID=A0A0D2BRE2_9EURO|nr:uncharacterized protein PV08_02213 [Exophiala spinifera]KIW21633.1 hypothetical protein PV08_02213 [Exophiala spinifera]